MTVAWETVVTWPKKERLALVLFASLGTVALETVLNWLNKQRLASVLFAHALGLVFSASGRKAGGKA